MKKILIVFIIMIMILPINVFGLSVSSRSACLIDSDSGRILYEKDKDTPPFMVKEIKEQPKKAPQFKLLEKPKPTRAQVQNEARKSAMQARKIMAVACAVIMFMAMVIYSRVQLDEINREIKQVESAMKIAQSDTVRLNNSLNSVVSINKVEDYALNVLGMVKVQDYQVVYVDLSGEDSVVMANGKTTDAQVINEEVK